MHSKLAALLVCLSLPLLAQESDVRSVNGKSVDLAPLHKWYATKKGPRPLPHWKKLTFESVGGNVGAWPQCKVKTEDGETLTILIANLPSTVRSHFTEIAALERERHVGGGRKAAGGNSKTAGCDHSHWGIWRCSLCRFGNGREVSREP
jgi:hypothetical protein